MIGAAFATLKLHRVEVVIASGVALAIAGWATYVAIRAAGVVIPVGCFDAYAAGGPGVGGSCGGAIQALGTFLADAGDNFRQATEFAPFVLGALVGVPIVAGELEARTASISWYLYPSRRRWLIGQLMPVAIVAGLAISVTAVTSEVIQHFNDATNGGYPDPIHIGTYGYGFVARAFAAFGIAIALGALLGRQLPAFLLAVALGLGCVTALGTVRNAWYAAHETHVIAADERGWPTGWAFLTPAGQYISREASNALVPPEIVALDVGSPQPMAASTWLEDHGYTEVTIGISVPEAMRWAPIEAGAYLGLGLASMGIALVLVNRRRPR